MLKQKLSYYYFLLFSIILFESSFSMENTTSIEQLENECCICFYQMEKETTFTNLCGHKFHKECMKCWIEKGDVCPLCRGIISEVLTGFCLSCLREGSEIITFSCNDYFCKMCIESNYSVDSTNCKLCNSHLNELDKKMITILRQKKNHAFKNKKEEANSKSSCHLL